MIPHNKSDLYFNGYKIPSHFCIFINRIPSILIQILIHNKINLRTSKNTSIFIIRFIQFHNNHLKDIFPF